MSEKSREKLSDTLKAIGHKPRIRGGNGRGLTRPQQLLLTVLDNNWKPEYCISLGKKQPGFPTNYKVDIGDPARRIAIEVDGNTHNGPGQRQKDRKKDDKLRNLGWYVIRIRNATVLKMFGLV